MTSLSFLDVIHRTSALEWWRQTGSAAAFTRVRQLSWLRVAITATMDRQPQLVTFDRALKNRGADCLVLR
jgi:hypothetical protein